ncbi:MAG: hypothetical protein GWO24_34980, partial [Akkermansiaceae bacterium]|nr:hypothetical protein [Akkermansiaceae bacterium]
IQGEPGGDFWGWGEFAPTKGRVIRNKKVELKRATPKQAVIEVRNEWMAGERLMMGEVLSVVVSETGRAY